MSDVLAENEKKCVPLFRDQIRSSLADTCRPISVRDTKGLYIHARYWVRSQENLRGWVTIKGHEKAVDHRLAELCSAGASGHELSHFVTVIIGSERGKIESPSLRLVPDSVKPDKVARLFYLRARKSKASKSAMVQFWPKVRNKGMLRKTARPRLESPIIRARRLDEKGRTDAALDLIYDWVDEMLRNEKMVELDSALTKLSVADLSTDLLLGVLTATLPARNRLPSRSRLFAEIEKAIRNRGEYEEGLLTGLE
jgi:hypothetical protein